MAAGERGDAGTPGTVMPDGEKGDPGLKGLKGIHGLKGHTGGDGPQVSGGLCSEGILRLAVCQCTMCTMTNVAQIKVQFFTARILYGTERACFFAWTYRCYNTPFGKFIPFACA